MILTSEVSFLAAGAAVAVKELESPPPELTIQNYCEYNGYDTSWCDQAYIDYLNEWYADDWTLFKDFDSWEKKAKKIFKKWY